MDKKKILALFSLVIILAFIGYIVYDTVKSDRKPAETVTSINDTVPGDKWQISTVIEVQEGLKAVTATSDGNIYAGGDSYIVCYNNQLNKLWQIETPTRVTALATYGDTLFATSEEVIYLINSSGEIICEWGPYEANCLITSASANKDYLAVADAGNKIVFIIKKDGEVHSMIGHFGEKLLIPSPYFDVYLTEDNKLYMAHIGKFRIETWTTDGWFVSSFGESGTTPDAFCGCCNPAHFTFVQQGFITAEKGINRIKILGPIGEFIEYVSSVNDFVASAPLDVTSPDGKIIYGANPADSKLYVFERK
jgi:hypothetical protein